MEGLYSVINGATPSSFSKILHFIMIFYCKPFEEPWNWVFKIRVKFKVGFGISSGNEQFSTTSLKINRPSTFIYLFLNRHLLVYLENWQEIQRNSQISCKFGERAELDVHSEKEPN